MNYYTVALWRERRYPKRTTFRVLAVLRRGKGYWHCCRRVLQEPSVLHKNKANQAFKLLPVCLLVAAQLGTSQSPPLVEVYGPVSALQVYNSLGTNISSSNEWEYRAAQAAHITWGRFDCPWQDVERQKAPQNISLGYSLPQNCASGLAYGKQYNVHSIVDALYGAPYTKIASAITLSDSRIGATVIPVSLLSGSMDDVRLGQTYVKLDNLDVSSRHAYAGTLIIAKTATSITLASALTRSIPHSSTLTLNIQLYPPVLLAPGSGFEENRSVHAYGSYVQFLQRQIAASGFSGRVSIWNEPPWAGDPWDDAANMYDTPPVEQRLKASFGVELAYYASELPVISNAPLDNGYTNKTGNGSLFEPDRRADVIVKGYRDGSFASESFHPYGNNPEDSAWIPSCVKTHNTPATYGQVYRDCTPAGMVTGSNIKWEAAFNSPSVIGKGLPLGITETGLCRCNNPIITEEQVSRFDLRQFLIFAASDVHPIVFYRLAGDKSYEWLHSDHSPYPVYNSFRSLMKDLSAIAAPPVASLDPSNLPKIDAYSGAYPLAVAVFVGGRSGDKLNSLVVYTWQRTYSSGKWVALASPAAAEVSMHIPIGHRVAGITDTVTLTPVRFNIQGRILKYPVTDDPVEIMLLPATM